MRHAKRTVLVSHRTTIRPFHYSDRSYHVLAYSPYEPIPQHLTADPFAPFTLCPMAGPAVLQPYVPYPAGRRSRRGPQAPYVPMSGKAVLRTDVLCPYAGRFPRRKPGLAIVVPIAGNR